MFGEKKGLTIFPKLLLTMLLVALIPLAGLWYINSYQVQDDWKRNLDESLRKTSNGLAAQVNDWIDLNVRVLEQNAALEGIKSMDAERQNPILKSIDEVYNWTYLVFTIAPDGQTSHGRRVCRAAGPHRQDKQETCGCLVESHNRQQEPDDRSHRHSLDSGGGVQGRHKCQVR